MDGRRPTVSRRSFLGGTIGVGAAVALGTARSAGAGSPAAATPLTANCFGKADNARLDGLRVFRIAVPPADDTVDATYTHWPLTDATTRADFSASTWSGNKWHYVWSNRATTGPNHNPNPIPPPVVTYLGKECRTQYSSIALANAATQGFIRYTLGRSDYADPWVDAGGAASDFVPYSDYTTNPAAYFTTPVTFNGHDYQVSTDVPLLPAFRLVDVHPATPGVFLDYEVADRRSTAESTAFVQDIADDLHDAGRQLFLFTDPLNGPSQPNTGLTSANLPALSRDYIDILGVYLVRLSGQTVDFQQSYDDQIDVLRGPSGAETVAYDRLSVVFDVDTNSTSADATIVHSILTDPDPHPTVLTFFSDPVAGGACGSALNDKIAIACFGTT